MPMNSTAKIAAAQVSVVRALRHSGFSNAGTPSLMASTPVSATAPDEKARSRSSSESTCSGPSTLTSVTGGGT